MLSFLEPCCQIQGEVAPGYTLLIPRAPCHSPAAVGGTLKKAVRRV